MNRKNVVITTNNKVFRTVDLIIIPCSNARIVPFYKLNIFIYDFKCLGVFLSVIEKGAGGVNSPILFCFFHYEKVGVQALTLVYFWSNRQSFETNDS